MKFKLDEKDYQHMKKRLHEAKATGSPLVKLYESILRASDGHTSNWRKHG